MIRYYDENRYKIEKPETAEEYLLLEIERLKEENEKLKKEVEQEKRRTIN